VILIPNSYLITNKVIENDTLGLPAKYYLVKFKSDFDFIEQNINNRVILL